ncbi:hypothetical protein [Pseudonocardia endophytica]|uniref:Small secreted domain DUF320 n=1 Tax=Pseudonocardia endophytica TaxID=401976 RepID=A0A4R1I091_PSEEN|nr:hypothetical protein [Pseudonocardia endophytica]TCK25849.1 hypothetical protein EV378_1675 [Pseudonocardia endophytica]
MLKKAGLITAGTLAALVTVGGIAFATEGGNQNSDGLVNGLNGNNLNAPIQACNNDIQGQVGLVPVQDVAEDGTVPLNGALGGLLGSAQSDQQSSHANIRDCGQGSGGAGYGNSDAGSGLSSVGGK